MSSNVHAGTPDALTAVPSERYDVLRHPHCIRILEFLEEDAQPSLRALTTALLERDGTDSTDGQARHEVRLGLVHDHLPRLADHGLIRWSVDDGIELVDEPPVSPDILSMLLEMGTGAEKELLDRLVHPVRLRLLEFVESRSQPISVDELATMLATRTDVGPSGTHEMTIALHHNHLPALDELDALTYDREAGLVH